MRTVLAIMRREIQGYFVSPLAYVFLTVFLFVVGVGFFYGLQRYAMIGAAFSEQANITLRTYLVAGRYGIVGWMNIAILLSLPGLSMRLFSEERKVGTIELLFTSPITTAQLVAGKYLGTLAVYALMLCLTTPLVAVLAWKGRPEYGALAVAYLGVFFFGATVLAIGLFASALTESQFVALVVAYAILLPFLLVQLLLGFTGPAMDLALTNLSVTVGLDRMSLGLLDSHYLVLDASIVFSSLFLCSRVLDSGRWR